MNLRSIRHRGLRRFVDTGDGSGLPQVHVEKIKKMLTFLQRARSETDLEIVPVWRAHRLTGNRKGTWSFHVSPNWRLTLVVNAALEVADLDLEDYH